LVFFFKCKEINQFIQSSIRILNKFMNIQINDNDIAYQHFRFIVFFETKEWVGRRTSGEDSRMFQ
jgi:hypothetical protein